MADQITTERLREIADGPAAGIESPTINEVVSLAREALAARTSQGAAPHPAAAFERARDKLDALDAVLGPVCEHCRGTGQPNGIKGGPELGVCSWCHGSGHARQGPSVLTAAARVAPEPVAVKPLEWEQGGSTEKPIWTPSANLWPCWIVLMDGVRYVWCEEIGIEFAPVSGVRGTFKTLEAAQAAAQADYEARIRSALASPSIASPGREEVLEEFDGDRAMRWREAGLREAVAIIEASQQECKDFPVLWNRHNVLLDRIDAALRTDPTDWRAMFFWPDAKRRLWFISDCLARHGQVNRADICEAFGVSVPQASADLREWQRLHPGAVEYDKSAKTYRPSAIRALTGADSNA